MKYDAFIFDIDGVLLDTSKSFIAAAVDAVIYTTGSHRFTPKEVAGLKSIRGFNNDWYVAIAGVCWVEFFKELTFDKFLQNLDNAGGGLSGLEQVYPDLKPEYKDYIKRLTMEAYAGTTACDKLYGFKPKDIKITGRWKTEKPLVSAKKLENISHKSGVVTGRAKPELNLAFELLNWRLPDDVVAWSDDSSLDKPNPKKLIGIIKHLKSTNPVYIGDSRDDLELVKNYRQLTGDQMDFCLIGMANGIKEYDFAYANVNSFLDEVGV